MKIFFLSALACMLFNGCKTANSDSSESKSLSVKPWSFPQELSQHDGYLWPSMMKE